MVEGYRVAFAEIEDGFAKFRLYRDDELLDYLDYPIEELPNGVNQEQLGKQFRPEFDDDDEIVALHYDKELTERKHAEAQEAIAEYREMVEDN